jgi:hypothetical protein
MITLIRRYVFAAYLTLQIGAWIFFKWERWRTQRMLTRSSESIARKLDELMGVGR